LSLFNLSKSNTSLKFISLKSSSSFNILFNSSSNSLFFIYFSYSLLFNISFNSTIFHPNLSVCSLNKFISYTLGIPQNFTGVFLLSSPTGTSFDNRFGKFHNRSIRLFSKLLNSSSFFFISSSKSFISSFNLFNNSSETFPSCISYPISYCSFN